MTHAGRTVPRRSSFAREADGQIAAMGALLLTLILTVGGYAVDYGSVYLAHARFRNATDAAALAGANERQRNPAGGEAAVRSVALQYLALHGYVPDSRTTITVTLQSGGARETVRVEATRTHPTYFLRLIGVNSVSFGSTTEAAIGAERLDVVLSIDITASMNPQMPELRQAARAFLDQLDPSPSNPNGPQVALVVFNGMRTPSRALGQGNRVVQVATHLTLEKELLKKIVDDSGAATCPAAWPSPQPPWVDTTPNTINRICPLKSQGGSGTYIGNGFEAALRPDQAWNLWAASNGGRPDAKRVLVLITDGTNNVPGLALSDLNDDTRQAAEDVKRGPDGLAGTSDDVEIFTVGFFDTDQDPSNFATNPPLCPAAIMPPNPSSNDSLLTDASSSKPGSCDHYYPLNKDQLDQLPSLFTTIAKQILRSRLVQ